MDRDGWMCTVQFLNFPGVRFILHLIAEEIGLTISINKKIWEGPEGGAGRVWAVRKTGRMEGRNA